jgi:hypothetical protein
MAAADEFDDSAEVSRKPKAKSNDERNVVTFPYQGNIIKLIVSDFDSELDLDRLTYIDLNNLLAEIVTFPTILNRLGNMEAIAADALREAELSKRIAEAQFKNSLREQPSPNKDPKGGDKGWTEGQATDKWYASAIYKVKRKLVNSAQFRHELVKSAYWAAKSKSDKLDKLSNQLTNDDLSNIKSNVINGIEIKIAKSQFGR